MLARCIRAEKRARWARGWRLCAIRGERDGKEGHRGDAAGFAKNDGWRQYRALCDWDRCRLSRRRCGNGAWRALTFVWAYATMQILVNPRIARRLCQLCTDARTLASRNWT